MEGQPHNEQERLIPLGEQTVPEQQRFKTLGVRIEEGLHAQLSFIAQLSGSTLADEIKGSIEARVRAAQEDPDLVARAEAVQAELQREAEARRQAIAGFFGRAAASDTVEAPEASAPTATTTAAKRPSTRRKPSGADGSERA